MNIVVAVPAQPLDIKGLVIVFVMSFGNRIPANFARLFSERSIPQGFPNLVPCAAFSIVLFPILLRVNTSTTPRLDRIFRSP
jgi:hypothetical protein